LEGPLEGPCEGPVEGLYARPCAKPFDVKVTLKGERNIWSTFKYTYIGTIVSHPRDASYTFSSKKDCQIKITLCLATFTITVWSVCLPSLSDRFLAQEVGTSNKLFEI
jgi:hypothetical protein